jgi:hypothetical protein
MSENNQAELINNVLGITREQLTRSMNLNAELEAVLAFERARVEELEKQVAELTAAAASSKEASADKK